jgi:hypothetical protein
MTNCDRELASVRSLLASCSDTRSVDAYCLAIIKVERQVRRLATVFSFACYTVPVPLDQVSLCINDRLYFVQLVDWFDFLSSRPYADLAGRNDWACYRSLLLEAEGHRNRLFHGCRTTANLDRSELERRTHLLIQLISHVADAATQWIGYCACSDTWSADLAAVRPMLRKGSPVFRDSDELTKAIRNRPKRKDLKLPQ